MSRLPILTFHSLDDSGSVISFDPGRFREIMNRLAEGGHRGLALGEALPPADRDRPHRNFAITFDDGYRNLLDRALPTLRELGFTATVYAVAECIGRDNRWPAGADDGVPRLPLADRSELRELVAAGWEVGSHGLAHRSLSALDDGELEREMADSQELLEAELETPIRRFAYPYGHHDRRVRAAARRHYDDAVGTRLANCLATDLSDRYALPRIDAYYLRSWPGDPLFGGLAGGSYLTLRRWARALRGSGR